MPDKDKEERREERKARKNKPGQLKPKPIDAKRKNRLKIKFEQKKDRVKSKEVFFKRATSGDIANPLSGSKFSDGHFTGVPLKEVSGSHCTLLQWINDNYPHYAVCRLDWKWEHSEISIIFYDKDDHTVVKQFGPDIVTGRDREGSSNFADQHMRIGLVSIRAAAMWVEDQLDEDEDDDGTD